jgi:hypothetical protein
MWDVMCNVSKIVIDIDKRCGYLYLPALNSPNMRSVIECFTSVDPEIVHIHTFVDGKVDTQYVVHDGEWIAI